MIGAFVAALAGRCPNCQRAPMYQSFLKLHETCPMCHVRFERWSGTWTVPTAMGYGAGAGFAGVLGYGLFRMGRLDGSEDILIPATLAFTVLVYPVCKNVGMFVLWRTGFVTVDPPRLVVDRREG